MKLEKVRKVVSVIKLVAPEFSNYKVEELRPWIELAEPFISENKFGSMYYQAMAYLTAHKMKINIPDQAEDDIGASIKNAFHVASYSEGDTSISFAANPAATGITDAEYTTTAYGVQFLSIKKSCIVPIAISGMLRY